MVLSCRFVSRRGNYQVTISPPPKDHVQARTREGMNRERFVISVARRKQLTSRCLTWCPCAAVPLFYSKLQEGHTNDVAQHSVVVEAKRYLQTREVIVLYG